MSDKSFDQVKEDGKQDRDLFTSATVVLNDSLSKVEPSKYNAPTFDELDVYYAYAQREVEKKTGWGDSYMADEDSPESVLVIKSTDRKVSLNGRSKHHLLNAILHAYNNHVGLRLTPDDILQCFSSVVVQCINDNSEKYRDVFVNHQGKKKLVVVTETPPGVFDWGSLLGLMSAEIDKNVKTSLGLESEFSNTTDVTRSVSHMMKMAAFKSYFSYGFMLCCGIRKVQLTGTLDDWLKLREKVVKCLGIFVNRGDMVNWGRHFVSVLNMLIETYQCTAGTGEKNTGIMGTLKNLVSRKSGTASSAVADFWSRIVTYVPYGSGGQSYISGWSQVLFPGTKYNKFPEKLNVLDSSSKPPTGGGYEWQDKMAKWAQMYDTASSGLSKVEAELNDHGLVYDFCCTVGHLGWNVDGEFAYSELGYVVHAVPKDKPTVTNEAEMKVVESGVSTMTMAVVASRDNLGPYREKQKEHLVAIKAYQDKNRKSSSMYD